MPSRPQSMLAWKICITISHFFALSACLVRLLHRWRTKLLWWDDYLVIFPWFFDFVGIILFWLQYKSGTILWDSTEYNTFLFSWWLLCFLAFSIVWLSRISISLSIARIFMPGHPFRKVALSFAGAMCLLYVVSVVVTTIACRGSPWWNLEIQSCMSVEGNSFKYVPALLFAFDVVSDLSLVAGPLLMLWRIKFPRFERILVLFLFSSSTATLAATIVYCAFYDEIWHEGPNSRLLFVALGHLQASLSLFASNLLVVAMLVYRVVRNRYGPRHLPEPPIRRATPIPVKPAATSLEPCGNNHDRQILSAQPSNITPLTLTVLSDRAHHFEPSYVTHDHSFTSLPLTKPPLKSPQTTSLP